MGARNDWGAWCLTFSLLACAAVAQEPAATSDQIVDESAIHDELRAMREALTKAVLAGDADAQIAHVHENVVVTWQNNQVVRGVDGLKTFLQEMNSQQQRVFKGYKIPPTTDELTILYGGDTGIAFGSSTPHYDILGMEFDLENRWTATLVKTDGQWKIAAYHVSGNILDNPVLNMAKNAAYVTGGVCLGVGLLLGIVLTSLWKKRKLRNA